MSSTHVYLSTACLHDQHKKCRDRCKYCDVQCICRCHQPGAVNVENQRNSR